MSKAEADLRKALGLLQRDGLVSGDDGQYFLTDWRTQGTISLLHEGWLECRAFTPGLVNWAWYVSIALFGTAVGASELVARYRDAPFMALRTGAARWYIAVNGAASLLAYVLIVKFGFEFGATPTQQGPRSELLVATFGSMVFFRSSLFTVKVG